MRYFYVVLVMFGFVFATQTCKQRTPTSSSDVKIIRGKEIPDSMDPQVILIQMTDPKGKLAGFCSAFAVSDHVLMTAAHCVVDMETKPYLRYDPPGIKILKGMGQGVPATRIIVPDLFTTGIAPDGKSVENKAADVALIIYPKGTFSLWLPLSANQPEDDEVVRLIGYGGNADFYSEPGETRQQACARVFNSPIPSATPNPSDPKKVVRVICNSGVKREGFAEVYTDATKRYYVVDARRREGEKTVGDQPSDTSNAGTAGGDSGSPLLYRGEVIGVTSRSVLKYWDIFTRLALSYNHEFLANAAREGYTIAGLDKLPNVPPTTAPSPTPNASSSQPTPGPGTPTPNPNTSCRCGIDGSQYYCAVTNATQILAWTPRTQYDPSCTSVCSPQGSLGFHYAACTGRLDGNTPAPGTSPSGSQNASEIDKICRAAGGQKANISSLNDGHYYCDCGRMVFQDDSIKYYGAGFAAECQKYR